MNPLLERVKELEVLAKALSAEIEAQGQFVATAAFDDVLYGLRKTQGVWNHGIEFKPHPVKQQAEK